METGGGWAAVADAVASRRTALGYSSQRAFAEAHPFSERTVSAIESHERHSYARATISHLERALRWAPGSVDRVLGGGDPIEQPPETSPPLPTQGEPLWDSRSAADQAARAENRPLKHVPARALLAELAHRLEEGGRRGEAPDLVAGVNYPYPDEVDDTGQAGKRQRRPETG